MTYPLPSRTHLVHKAIDASKLSAKNSPVLDDRTGLPSARHYIYQRKYDGCCVIVIIDPELNVTFWSRDGKPCTSLTHLIPALQRLPGGAVLFAEAWRPGKEFREISGAFRRKAEQPELGLRVFDTVRLHEFEAGESNVPYSLRYKVVLGAAAVCNSPLIQAAEECFTWEIGELAARADEAYDGAVAKRRDGPWVAGAGTGGEVLKIKNVVDVDLEVLRVEEEHDKHGQPKGRLGAAVCRFEGGVELRVGSGFSALERAAWWAEPHDIIGRVIRVLGMKGSGKGSLREPRFKGVRHDKMGNPDY